MSNDRKLNPDEILAIQLSMLKAYDSLFKSTIDNLFEEDRREAYRLLEWEYNHIEEVSTK